MASDLAVTRDALHQLAVFVLGRRRHDVTGHFGLRPLPGGFGTPAFGGDDVEVVRISGRFLVVERGAAVVVEPITTLRRAADIVGVDLDGDFSVGADTPACIDPGDHLDVDDGASRLLGAWWAFGLETIDEVVGTDEAIISAMVPQLWPEHFDLGCTVERGGEHLNVGASPGDSFSSSPYLYVGPWSARRPGDDAYWNTPFGAALTMAALDELPTADRRARARAFLAEGVSRY